MILAQKQRPMEQKRRPRNKTIKPWSSDVWQRCQRHTYTGEKSASATNVTRKTGYLHAEDWN
jgi:hypothetical protein